MVRDHDNGVDGTRLTYDFLRTLITLRFEIYTQSQYIQLANNWPEILAHVSSIANDWENICIYKKKWTIPRCQSIVLPSHFLTAMFGCQILYHCMAFFHFTYQLSLKEASLTGFPWFAPVRTRRVHTGLKQTCDQLPWFDLGPGRNCLLPIKYSFPAKYSCWSADYSCIFPKWVWNDCECLYSY